MTLGVVLVVGVKDTVGLYEGVTDGVLVTDPEAVTVTVSDAVLEGVGVIVGVVLADGLGEASAYREPAATSRVWLEDMMGPPFDTEGVV